MASGEKEKRKGDSKAIRLAAVAHKKAWIIGSDIHVYKTLNKQTNK